MRESRVQQWPLLARPRFPSLMVSGLFAALSLTPSLLPRSWVTQGVVTGVALAIGYGFGSAGATALRPVARRVDVRFASSARAVIVAIVALALGLGVGVHH